MDNLWFFISIILSIVLTTTLFFKSALNNILNDIWVERGKIKKDSLNRYINLKMNVGQLLSLVSWYLFDLRIYCHADNKNLKKDSFLEMEKHFDNYKIINDDFKLNEHYYTIEIRNLIKDLNQKFNSAMSETTSSLISFEQHEKLIQEIRTLIENIIKSIEIKIDKLT